METYIRTYVRTNILNSPVGWPYQVWQKNLDSLTNNAFTIVHNFPSWLNPTMFLPFVVVNAVIPKGTPTESAIIGCTLDLMKTRRGRPR